MLRLAFVIMVAALLAPSASAACWKLRNGRIVETNSNSTPPERQAEKVKCPAALLTAPPPTVSKEVVVDTIEQHADARQCVPYVRSMMSLPPGVPVDKPDAAHKEWKRQLINSGTARPGSAAIISASSAWHIAYVEDVVEASGRASITISETNYRGGYFTRRKATGQTLRDIERKLNIEGYYR